MRSVPRASRTPGFTTAAVEPYEDVGEVHVKRLFQAIVLVAMGLVSLSASSAPRPGGEGDPGRFGPQSAWDCANACNDCQGDCGRMPAGAARAGCEKACTSSAARCCSGYGKKPPSTDCYCQ